MATTFSEPLLLPPAAGGIHRAGYGIPGQDHAEMRGSAIGGGMFGDGYPGGCRVAQVNFFAFQNERMSVGEVVDDRFGKFREELK